MPRNWKREKEKKVLKMEIVKKRKVMMRVNKRTKGLMVLRRQVDHLLGLVNRNTIVSSDKYQSDIIYNSVFVFHFSDDVFVFRPKAERDAVRKAQEEASGGGKAVVKTNNPNHAKKGSSGIKIKDLGDEPVDPTAGNTLDDYTYICMYTYPHK